jgi:Uma2 family endonuclease
MVAEVLPPSTRGFDIFAKVDEYKGVDGIDYILLIESNAPEVVMWVREGDGWRTERTEGFEDSLSLDGIGVTIGLSELYDEVEFPSGLRLAFGRLPDRDA